LPIVPDGRTIIAEDESGQVHFLELVEADKTKPSPSEIKISLLFREQQSTDNQRGHLQRRWLDQSIDFLHPLVSQENFTLWPIR
jgi:hypothetical protein